MRAKWLCLVALTAAAVGCGEGRAIFDIDVFSFLSGANADTLPYVGPLSATIPVQTIRSLGLGSSSIVDTVRFIGSVNFVNASGTGNVTFQVYFDSAKSTVYTGTPPVNVSGAVTPNATTTSLFDVDITDPAMRRLFLASTVYVASRYPPPARYRGRPSSPRCGRGSSYKTRSSSTLKRRRAKTSRRGVARRRGVFA